MVAPEVARRRALWGRGRGGRQYDPDGHHGCFSTWQRAQGGEQHAIRLGDAATCIPAAQDEAGLLRAQLPAWVPACWY